MDYNSWQINQRTNIDGGEDTPDVEQWGGIKLVKTVLDNVNASLSDIEALRKADNSKYIPFVEQHKEGEYFNHDLLHIITQRSISSLMNTIEVAKDKKAVKDRINQIEDQTVLSYKKAGDTDAYILSSMQMIERRTEGSGSNEKKIKALEDLLAENKVKSTHTSVEILIELAKLLEVENPSKAVEYCNLGLKDCPDYKRTKYLKEIKENILKPYVNFSLPAFAYPGENRDLYINHRNLDKVEIVFYKIPESLHKIVNDNQTYKLKDEDLKKCTEVSSATYALERPADYKTTSTTVKIQIPSEPGIYTCKAVAAKESVFNWNIMRTGRMKLMTNNWKDRNLEVIVVDRMSGQPVEGAKVILTKHPNHSNKKEQVLEKKSGKDGKLTFFLTEEEMKNFSNTVYVKAELGDDRYMHDISANTYRYQYQDFEDVEGIQLLTDRSIYRPGQTVYVKGIYYTQKDDQGRVLQGKKFTVLLKNHNRETVDKKDVKTNGYGSFETSFQIPASGLMGVYNIEVEGKTRRTISVEEYKRPTFEVKADRIEGSYKFGDKIQVKADAKTFSGVPLDQADVKYTVSPAANGAGGGWMMKPYLRLEKPRQMTMEQSGSP